MMRKEEKQPEYFLPGLEAECYKKKINKNYKKKRRKKYKKLWNNPISLKEYIEKIVTDENYTIKRRN
jgi:hypothetical protein